MKRVITVAMLLCIIAIVAFADSWGYVGGLGNAADTTYGYGHGITVDGAGKIWYVSYYGTETVMKDTGATTSRAVYVFNPDGTPASFSPITVGVLDDAPDTLLDNSNRGIRADNNGDVVVSSYNRLMKFNHLTGAGMMGFVAGDSSYLTSAGFTSEGEMLVGNVLPGHGVYLYDSDWELIDQVISDEDANSYCRTIEIAKDGSALYRSAYTAGCGFVRWNSSDGTVDGSYGPPTAADSLAIGLAVESAAWQPVTGYLWGGQSYADNLDAGWKWGAHYAFDPADNFALVDSIVFPAMLGQNPRGIDFSPDGNTAYLVSFTAPDAIFKVVKGAVGIWEHTGTFINGYSMKANYPNPFNPSTKLDVTMKEAGVADLRVYDIRGAEVAVINNSYLPAGDHSFTFNGSNLAAGVYIAKFMVNGAMYTQNMTLIK
jgi:hypothetical protein